MDDISYFCCLAFFIYALTYQTLCRAWFGEIYDVLMLQQYTNANGMREVEGRIKHNVHSADMSLFFIVFWHRMSAEWKRELQLFHVSYSYTHSHDKSNCYSMIATWISPNQAAAVNNRSDSHRERCFRAVWRAAPHEIQLLVFSLLFVLSPMIYSTLQYRTDLQASHPSIWCHRLLRCRRNHNTS